MFTKEIQFRQVPTSKSFILEKSLSLWIYKRSLTGKIIFWSLLYCNIDARSIQFLSNIKHCTHFHMQDLSNLFSFPLTLLFYLIFQKQPPELFYTKSCT